MHTEQHTRRQELEAAFDVFNQMSEQLAHSYQQLQQRVVRLNEELAAARNERMSQLVEKERLAGRLSHLLEVLPAGVVVLDGEERVQEFNPAAGVLLGAVSIGSNWRNICRQVVAAADGKELQLKNGRRVTLGRCYLAPEPGAMLLLVDVTETRRLQERLNRRQRLSAMGEMAARLAHQIRTPLAAALLDASHLARDDLQPLRRQQFSTRLRSRLKHMESQIRDMLIFARGGEGMPEPVALLPLFEELRQMLAPLFEKAHGRLTLRDDTAGRAAVLANRAAFSGAMSNLISNALEHGRDQVQLDIQLRIPTEGVLEIRVCDNGPGIPPELRSRVFDPFFTTSHSGTGLGLTVVQSVILANGGQIDVLDAEEGGTCFRIQMPLLEGHASAVVGSSLGDGTEDCSRSSL